MKLADWIDRRIEKTNHFRTVIREELAEKSGVSLVTISSVDNGMKLKSYEKAKALSDATNGAVSVEDLCG